MKQVFLGKFAGSLSRFPSSEALPQVDSELSWRFKQTSRSLQMNVPIVLVVQIETDTPKQVGTKLNCLPSPL